MLEGIEDTRRERSVWYPLHETLFIMLTAVICGATSYAKVEMFGYSRKGMTAGQVLEARRSHWTIENQLHWVLDMQFQEDESRAGSDNSAENLNVLRQWAYNLLKSDTSVRGSFSGIQFKCLLNKPYLDKIIRSAFGS